MRQGAGEFGVRVRRGHNGSGPLVGYSYRVLESKHGYAAAGGGEVRESSVD